MYMYVFVCVCVYLHDNVHHGGNMFPKVINNGYPQHRNTDHQHSTDVDNTSVKGFELFFPGSNV